MKQGEAIETFTISGVTFNAEALEEARKILLVLAGQHQEAAVNALRERRFDDAAHLQRLADALNELLPAKTTNPNAPRRDWGVAWFGRASTSGICERCQQAKQVYEGFNGGAHAGKFCGACREPVLRREP